ncbi:flagellar basal body-associated FliL family protein [Dyella sp.]|jgi:flagellar FliL protein|uniref:flagellar basal body-associated FliL family protein n=1 Tax=Dyella sp. TaxID=1869338 RepID=UPI002D79AD1F|nr:flagellar basal body-associated FliL family protein [Dyella sp.]HET6431133.1 flagellar basal body-associated FliL family protein [Dyella sp.]
MENDELDLTVTAPKPGPKRGRLIAIIAVVLLLGAGAGAYAVFGGKKAPADEAAKAAPEKKAEFFLPLEPAFVVNFRDDESVRYLQVGVTVMSHDAAALETVKEAQPVIRNELLMLFSGQSYAGLIDAAGKQKLQAQALAAVQKIISERTGKPGIDALYFTSFVMQ